MSLRRGFKAEAERMTQEVRSELGLGLAEPLNPFELTKHLGIPALTLSSLDAAGPAALQQLRITDPHAFSAITVFQGSRRCIIYNDGPSYSTGWRASSMAHEASHALLLHPPTPAIDQRGCRIWDDDIEDEATWLGATLLVPGSYAVALARTGFSDGEAAEIAGVTEGLMRWRINMTGARTRATRRARVARPTG